MEDGLVNNSVSGIIQDRNGYIWFGTQNGLNRYDGKNFVLYDSEPFERNSLPHNQIQTLYLDPVDPYLWIGTYEGLSRFNLVTEEFLNFTSDPNISENVLSDGIVTAVLRDRNGDIWVGTLEGLNHIDRRTGEIRVFRHNEEDDNSLLHNSIRALMQGEDGRIWIGSYGGLDVYDPEKELFTHYRSDPGNPAALQSSYVMALAWGPNGTLWTGTWDGGITLFNTREGRVEKQIPLEDNVYLLSAESSSSLWIGTWGNGLYHWKAENPSLEHFMDDPDDRYKLNHGIVYSFLKDRSGLYWIGTNGAGINKLNPKKKDFRYLYHIKGDDKTLPMDNIITITIDSRGDFWVGTYSHGLWRFPGDGSDSSIHNWMPDEEDPFSLSHKNVHSILEDSRGNLWVGSLGGLDKFNPETEDFDHIPLKGLGYDENTEPIIYSLTEDRDGTFWIGTYSSGVIHWSEEGGVLDTYSYNPENPELSNNLVFATYLDSRGDLWVGTNRGLNRYDRETDTFNFLYHDPDNNGTLSSNYITVILEDSLKNLWIGTDGGGLNLYNREKGEFSYFIREDGLISNHIQSILEDDRQRLWIGTINGLSILNTQSREFLTVDSSDGIMAPKMDFGAAKGRDGALYFGSREGILRFEPIILYDNHIPPQLYFNEVRVMDQSIHFSDYLNGENILELPWDRNYISFDFIALDFTSSERNLYRYKMAGLDRDWVNSANRNFASYSNLKPGYYTFMVQGSNNDGVWNTDSLELSIRIKAAPWQQKWFIFIYIALGVLLFIVVSNLQANFLLRKKLRDVESSRNNLQDINNRLEEMAWKDALTGLANRRYFDLALSNLWHLAVREKKMLTVLMIDVDFFKAYNDLYGHQMGDQALRKTGEIIRSILRRETDAVCRYGGEEFTVLLFDIPPEETRIISENLLEKMRQARIPHESSSVASYLTISIGLSGMVPGFEQDAEVLVSTADAALYKAKEKGRNRMEYYNPNDVYEVGDE